MNESFTVAADGSYAARLTSRPGTELWYPERWTLGGPEPYAVPLPVHQPEDAGSEVLPLADGRVLIARPAPGHWSLALLYPSGPETGEVRLGTVETRQLRLLPPAPCGTRAYALAAERDGRATGVWRVAGGASRTPERVARIEGRCSGGAWLDPEGRLLAVDATGPGGRGPVKTVTVDLARGAVSPLLQITEESEDRLLLADPDSGLLLVRSDAPGQERLGWGVLGSHRPVRFPEVLHPHGTRLTPIAVQPGQTLLPERCGIALRVDTAQGTWLAVWRPGLKELRHVASPPGWLTGQGLWTAEGELRVPYSTAHNPCGLARMRTPLPDTEETPHTAARHPGAGRAGGAASSGAATAGTASRGSTAEGRTPAPATPLRTPAPTPTLPSSRPAPAAASAPARTPALPSSRPAPAAASARPASAPAPALSPSHQAPAPVSVPTSAPAPAPASAPAAPAPSRGPGPGPASPVAPEGAVPVRPAALARWTPLAPVAPPARGAGVAGSGDVTGLQHPHHGGPPTGLLGSMVRRAVSAGGTGSFGLVGEPARKPVPLQQSPLTSGTA
ncbi:hypothetical protein SALCHL_001907 [Streptomyces albus subsp. chlorinus]|uniref:hypothetical protein n=1 Tax=Streptomyces albus TaxID=1888 RepID=UPI003D0D1BEA